MKAKPNVPILVFFLKMCSFNANKSFNYISIFTRTHDMFVLLVFLFLILFLTILVLFLCGSKFLKLRI